jgi:hypothetical protein
MNEDSRSIVSVDVNKSGNGAAISDVIDRITGLFRIYRMESRIS